MNLSIMTACFPYLKPFLESLESGMIRSDDLFRRQGGSKKGYGHRYPLGRTANPASSNRGKAHASHSIDSDSVAVARIPGETQSSDQDGLAISLKRTLEQHLNTQRNGFGHTFENLTRVTADSHRDTEADLESQSSQSRIIRQTTTWTVNRNSDDS